jgi:hypothetical protein
MAVNSMKVDDWICFQGKLYKVVKVYEGKNGGILLQEFAPSSEMPKESKEILKRTGFDKMNILEDRIEIIRTLEEHQKKQKKMKKIKRLKMTIEEVASKMKSLSAEDMKRMVESLENADTDLSRMIDSMKNMTEEEIERVMEGLRE